jgi:phosphohistidine phosphatase
MKLIFVRHGLAVDKKPNDDDSRRLLIKDGINETKKMARSFQGLFKNVNTIFTSPMLRAVQTAEILYKKTSRADFDFLVSLDATSAPEDFVSEVKRLSPKSHYCFVGHEPHLTNSVALLLNDNADVLKLEKSGLIILEGETFDSLKVTGLFSPKILSKIKL